MKSVKFRTSMLWEFTVPGVASLDMKIEKMLNLREPGLYQNVVVQNY